MMEKNNTLPEKAAHLLIHRLRKQHGIAPGTYHDPLSRALLASDYLAHQITRTDISLIAHLDQPVDSDWCQLQLMQWDSDTVDDRYALALFLRRFRHRAMVRIIARMANNKSSCVQTMAEVSTLARACISFAYEYFYNHMCALYGVPRDVSGNRQHLLVIAMGKLGGMELNLSSDIDLIFVYGEDGDTDSRDNSVSNRVFFTRLGQQLIRLLSEYNAQGFVFRVDMRLRPYGSSGALVASFSALEKYYHEQARQWERFALTRACVITGDRKSRVKLKQMIERYVYRQYVDFSVIDSLRSIKQDIRRMALRDDKSNDVKLGAGGIREIEFIAQTYQLIYGGKYCRLRSASTMHVLCTIASEGLLDSTIIEKLNRSYVFLRSVENYIQAYNDEQTHRLPTDDQQRYRLALAMHYIDWQQLSADCDHHRAVVQGIFDDLILGEQESANHKAQLSQKITQYSQALLNDERCQQDIVTEQGDARLRQLVIKINKSSDPAKQLCWRLMPFLLDAAQRTGQPDRAVIRQSDLIESIIRRPVYLNLLNENRSLFVLLGHILVISDWLYTQICQYPALLESCIHANDSTVPTTRSYYCDKLRRVLAGLAEDDEEQQIIAMRYFARESMFQVALGQVMNRLPLTGVSDALTYIAEACVEQALYLAWNHLSKRHGLPSDVGNDGAQTCRFAVIAYGKLGSLELNYSSDLDLVFVYSGRNADMTDGNRPVSNLQFYTRLAQRIIHLLTTPTSAGNGYQLDTRLRPQGSKGLLVNSVDGLRNYLLEHAWTWEHQALTRARPIAGDRGTIADFLRVRQQVLCQQREYATLSKQVWSMRQKIDSIKQDRDIKYGAGGLVDIEFLVQFLVLMHAQDHPAIIEYSDNMRQLQAIARAGIIDQQREHALINAYITLRSATHYIDLGIKEHDVDIYKQTQLVQTIQSSFRSIVPDS